MPSRSDPPLLGSPDWEKQSTQQAYDSYWARHLLRIANRTLRLEMRAHHPGSLIVTFPQIVHAALLVAPHAGELIPFPSHVSYDDEVLAVMVRLADIGRKHRAIYPKPTPT